MMLFSLILALITVITLTFLCFKKRKEKILYKLFMIVCITLIIHCLGLILQLIFKNTSISPIYFDYITYTGASFTPVFLALISFVYIKPNIKIRKFLFLCIFPVIDLLVLWTNDFHHLFYENYSINLAENIYGPFFYVYSLYSYLMFAIAIIIMLVASIKKSGFLSQQTILMTIGISIPIIVNTLGTLKIISMSVYITPILFIVTVILLYIAIFRLKALDITPIAFRTIIDTMSDAYIVISNDGTIVDNNQTFHNIFKDILNDNKEDNFFAMLSEKKLVDVNELKAKIAETRKSGDIVSADYHLKIVDEENSSEDETKYIFNKYFEVDIHPIKASRGKEYVGTLLLFKDVTQHRLDMQALEEKQDVIIKQQQLVSIGELAGGVAHDINTPISAIKTGITMMNTFYEPRDDREKELITRMDNCADRIIKIVNSMRNQIRNLGNTEKVKFKVSDVLKDTQVITFNEFQKNKCTLNINIQDDVEVMGEPTKLGQVFTNLVVNAVQAYPEGQGGKVEVDVSNAPEGKCIIKIRDYAGGIPDRIKDSVFKNILTTKGTKGTGLGLYLAYSVIKGEFSGDITFETEQGGGTTFYIVLDRADSTKPKEVDSNEKVEEKQEVNS